MAGKANFTPEEWGRVLSQARWLPEWRSRLPIRVDYGAS